MKDLWTCPECGRKFANPGQWHSCLVTTIDSHFQGKPHELRELFDALVRFIEQQGEVIINPVKTRISFQVRMNFAAVTVRNDRLDCHVVLRRKLDHERFTRTESFGGGHVHHFELTSVDDLDDDVQAWFAESYLAGAAAAD